MKTKMNPTLFPLLLMLLFIAPNLEAQYKNSANMGFKATDAQFGVEAQYARAINGMVSLIAKGGFTTITDNVSGADLGRISANSLSYGLGVDFTPMGNNAGVYLQANVVAVSSQFQASSGNSFLINSNCTAYQPNNYGYSFFDNTTYSGASTNFLLDTRLGYRISIKGTRFAIAPFVAFEKLLSNESNLVLNSGEGSVNFNQDRNLRVDATRIDNSSVSVDLQDLYKSNRFNTGFELLLRF